MALRCRREAAMLQLLQAVGQKRNRGIAKELGGIGLPKARCQVSARDFRLRSFRVAQSSIVAVGLRAAGLGIGASLPLCTLYLAT